jgi:hypothetical protein
MGHMPAIPQQLSHQVIRSPYFLHGDDVGLTLGDPLVHTIFDGGS